MECKALLAQIDALSDPYLDVLEDICNIESPTDYKEGVDAVGRYFLAFAEKHGWKTEVFEQPVSGNVICITMNPDSSERPIALSAHIDTVHPVGSFGTPAVRRDAEKMYGPGVMDCKGGAAAALLAMDALERCGYTARPVMLLLQTDEEKGSAPSKLATITWICEKAKDAVAFLNGEGHGSGKVTLQCKGILRFRYHVHGVSVHSSRCDAGANAVTEAAHKIIELEKMKDRETVTCNCGVISGGSVPNVVASDCIFFADIRYSTPEEAENVRKEVQRVADTVYVPGCTCTVEQVSGRPPMVASEKNDALLARMNEIYAANGMPTLTASKSTGGTDAAYTTQAGIPCVDSMGTEGGRIHSVEEYMLLPSLARSAKRMAAVIWNL